MSGKLPKLEGAIVVPTGGYPIELADADGTRNVTLPAGTYYWSSGATTLLAAIKTMLDDGGGTVTYTVSLDDATDTGTGRLTLTASSGSTPVITWTTTALRDLMGFTGSSTSLLSLTATGSNAVTHLWLPSVHCLPIDPYPTTLSQRWGRPERDYACAVAPSGAAVVTELATRYVGTLQFRPLWGRKFRRVLEVVGNESLEQFLEDLAGERFRYHTSRDEDALYWTLQFRDLSTLRGVNMTPPSAGAYSLHDVGPYDVVEYVS